MNSLCRWEENGSQSIVVCGGDSAKAPRTEGNPPDLKATMFFPSAGQKQLLLRFAKLEVVAE